LRAHFYKLGTAFSSLPYKSLIPESTLIMLISCLSNNTTDTRKSISPLSTLKCRPIIWKGQANETAFSNDTNSYTRYWPTLN
jgi:hypothetical protein